MTRNDLKCVHEPFGDAFYFGPERLSVRFEANEDKRLASGFSTSTYKTIIDRLEREGDEVRSTPFSAAFDYHVLSLLANSPTFISMMTPLRMIFYLPCLLQAIRICPQLASLLSSTGTSLS